MGKYLYAMLLSVCMLGTQAQVNGNASGASAKLAKAASIEKIYLSFDKPYYSAGDTLWFKAFLLDGENSRTTHSDRLYVELFNDSSRLVGRRVIALNNGLGYGDFALERKFSDGNYTVRAYTNWQQNFGADYFFQKQFYIGNTGNNSWLINSWQSVNTEGDKFNVNLKLKLQNLQNQADGFKDIDLALMSGKQKILTTSLRTNNEGIIDTKFSLPTNQNKAYTLLLTNKKNSLQHAAFPILVDSSAVDLQFMAEGGAMINGINGKLGFKAVGMDGRAQSVSGKIIDNDQVTVAEFSSTHNGMGSFFFYPQAGKTYITLYSVNGKEYRQSITGILSEGTSLRIDPLSNPDSLTISIRATTRNMAANYQLIAETPQKTILAFNVNLTKGYFNIKIPKSAFPDGTLHFKLLSPASQPLNERVVQVNTHKKIQLQVVANKNAFLPRDSVDLDITATDENGSPVMGAFSLAVTDDNQVKISENTSNIISYFLLESGVKGEVEGAGWYFSEQTAEKQMALDNLLLTQAWVGHRWVADSTPEQPIFLAEKGNLVTGKLTNLFNKPVPNIKMTMLSTGRGIFVADTLSGADGMFTFRNLPLIDTPQYLIKIKNERNKASSATITVNQFKPAIFSQSNKPIFPWYVNTDATLLNYNRNIRKQEDLSERGRILSGTSIQAVEIKGANQEIMSNLGWDAHIFEKFTEEELKEVPRKNLIDLLKSKIPGFKASQYWDTCGFRIDKHESEEYVVNSSRVLNFRFDKINTRIFAGPEPMFKNPVFKQSSLYLANRYLLFNYSAEDIKSIDVYKGCSIYYIDIITRGGHGPWLDKAKGTFVYRPLPIYVGKDFYSPKYVSSLANSGKDFRSTIFWDANVVTDETGKAHVSFYAADGLSKGYTIKIEGTDMQGRFGVKSAKINMSSIEATK